jgi:hypothetical protein
MSVRNCEEIGANLQKIMTRLFANQNLLKLLYYTDKDPYSQPDLTQEQIRKEIYEKLIKITPRVGPKETAHSILVIKVSKGLTDSSNTEFRNISIDVESFVPLTQWIIKDDNLRPFAIMGEIQKSLDGKTINGLGKMVGGDFSLNFLTEEISAYEQRFNITTYD